MLRVNISGVRVTFRVHLLCLLRFCQAYIAAGILAAKQILPFSFV